MVSFQSGEIGQLSDQFSRDFLEYFAATAHFLDDPSVFCISSWNDYGQDTLDHSPTRLFRTDYFPGLGWMLKRELWTEELKHMGGFL